MHPKYGWVVQHRVECAILRCIKYDYRPIPLYICCATPPRLRSFEVTTNYVGFGPRPQSVPHGKASKTPATPDPLLGHRDHPAKEGSHGSSHCLACGAHAPLWTASAGGMLAGPPLVAREVGLPSPPHEGGPSQNTVNIATGGVHPTEVTAAIVSPVSVETQRLWDGGKPLGTSEEIGADCGSRTQVMEPMSISLRSGYASEDQSGSHSHTTNDPEEACTDPAVIPIGDSIWRNGGLGNVEETNVVNDIATMDSPMLCGDLRLFEVEPEGAGICLAEEETTNAGADLGLTEDYLMGAAEALMGSSPLDGELGGEYGDMF